MKINDDIYRFYISNGVKILTSNTSRFAGGTELVKSYRDIIYPEHEETEEEKREYEQEAQSVMKHMISKIKKVRG